jgi:hypothetical protein
LIRGHTTYRASVATFWSTAVITDHYGMALMGDLGS